MLVKFTTKSYPDIVMFGNVAEDLLKLMGLSGKVPGAVLEEDLERCRDRLVAALADLDESDNTRDDEDNDDDEPVISLKQRAQPLIELIESAIINDGIVTWEQG